MKYTIFPAIAILVLGCYTIFIMTIENPAHVPFESLPHDGAPEAESIPTKEKIIDEESARRIKQNILVVCEKIQRPLFGPVNIPETYISNTEALRGVKVVMVDNDGAELISSIEPLAVATDGNLDVVIQEPPKGPTTVEEATENIAQQILKTQPDLVIMDYHLSFDVTGDKVIAKLRELGYTGKAVGSSGDASAADAFAHLLVPNAFDKKMPAGVDDEMSALAAIYTQDIESADDLFKIESNKYPPKERKVLSGDEELLEKLRAAGIDVSHLLSPKVDEE